MIFRRKYDSRKKLKDFGADSNFLNYWPRSILTRQRGLYMRLFDLKLVQSLSDEMALDNLAIASHYVASLPQFANASATEIGAAARDIQKQDRLHEIPDHFFPDPLAIDSDRFAVREAGDFLRRILAGRPLPAANRVTTAASNPATISRGDGGSRWH